MNKRTVGENILWSTINVGISSVITIFLLPYISNTIGIEAYGYVSLSSNIIQYIDLIASTINVYAVRYISIEYHRGNKADAEKYYSSVAIFDMVFVIVSVPVLCSFLRNLDNILNVNGKLLSDVRLLFLFAFISYSITIIGTVFSSAAFVKDILYKESANKAIGNILKITVLLLLFYVFRPHVWYVPTADCICTLFILLGNLIITKNYLNDIKIRPMMASVKLIAEIASKGIWNTISHMGSILNSGLDLIVTNIFLGETEMGLLSIPKTISVFVSKIQSAVGVSFRPQLLKYYSKNQVKELENGLYISMKCCGAVPCVVLSVFFTFGLSFLEMWIPKQNNILIYELTLLTFMSDTVTGLTGPLSYGTVLTGKLKVTSISILISGVFNVALMYVLLSVTQWGLFAVAFTTIIGNFFVQFLVIPLYVGKILNISIKLLYLQIIRFFISILINVIMIYLLFGRFYINEWMDMILLMGISSVISFVIYIGTMLNKKEKMILVSIVSNKIKKDGGKK